MLKNNKNSAENGNKSLPILAYVLFIIILITIPLFI